MSLLRELGVFRRELRRRHVVKVAAVYAGVAFVLVQGADLVIRGLDLPDWTYALLVVIAIFGFPLALVLAWAFDITPQGVHRTGPMERTGPVQEPPTRSPPPRGRDAVKAPPGEPRTPSIVVLPFENLSPNPEDEYFSEGITEDITARLASVPGLRVISRTSALRYRGAQKAIPEIAEELGVTHVIEGTVRRTEDRVRIVAQLVGAESDVHLWAETYDRQLEDVFAIQTEVASRVATALPAELDAEGEERFARVPTRSLEAYDLYLRGRHEWGRRTPASLERSLGHLEAAVELDPGFALARAAIADACVTLALYGEAEPETMMERARSAAEQALHRNPNLPEALTARGVVRALYDWDWEGGADDLRRALAVQPDYGGALQWHAMHCLLPLGRFREARSQLRRAGEIDPLSPVLRTSLGVLDYYERNWEAAEGCFRRLLDHEADFVPAHYFLGLVLAELGHGEEAVAELEKAAELGRRSSETLAALSVAETRRGRRDRAARYLRELEEKGARTYVSPVLFAQAEVALGRTESALDHLEQGVEVRAVELAWVGVRPTLDPLRGRDRFQAVEHRVLGGGSL